MSMKKSNANKMNPNQTKLNHENYPEVNAINMVNGIYRFLLHFSSLQVIILAFQCQSDFLDIYSDIFLHLSSIVNIDMFIELVVQLL